MNKTTFLMGLGVGAGIAYLLDAQLGRRRRGMLRDAIVGATHKAERGLATACKDAWHRVQGLSAEVMHRSEHKDDRAVRERVRAKIGHSLKSALANPVVVIVETTWKTEWRTASSPS